MTDEIEQTTTTDAVPAALPSTRPDRGNRLRQAPATPQGPATTPETGPMTPATAGDVRIVKPTGIMVDVVNVDGLTITRDGLATDTAEADRLVELAGTAPDGRPVLHHVEG